MAPSDFEFLTLIGKGSFGKVFLARRKEDDKFYAVKVRDMVLQQIPQQLENNVCSVHFLKLHDKKT